jgi:aldehyde:ferredoxin oxidoreductase
VGAHARAGSLPIKNLTTNVLPDAENLSGQRMRTTPALRLKSQPCWACNIRHHCSTVTIVEGPYAGFEGEEPEFEGMTCMGSALGITDTAAAVMLANVVDRVGLDINETAWVLGFAVECYLGGLLSSKDVDGLDLGWGKPDVMRALIERIARRQGVGELLANGVKEAARQIGGRALEVAVFTEKGNSPRGHDHRAAWPEMLDTCVSNTGTIEATGGYLDFGLLGLPPRKNMFDPIETAFYNAKSNGYRQFQDSLGCCRFTVDHPPLMVDALNAVTGWRWSFHDAMAMGRRVVHQLRAFNFRCGITAESERPSPRYGSVPVDGPARGAHFTADWPGVLRTYYTGMGWDPATGKPLPETLRALEQEELIPVFWS